MSFDTVEAGFSNTLRISHLAAKHLNSNPQLDPSSKTTFSSETRPHIVNLVA
jgi:hypothetical protein